MPPPIAQQGSRGGLITAVIVFAILFVTSTIFAIYFNVNWRASEDKATNTDRKYKQVITDGNLAPESEIATAVKALEGDPVMDNPDLRWVDKLAKRGDSLSRIIAGSEMPGLTAQKQAEDRITAINAYLAKSGVQGVTVGRDNLLSSVDTMSKAIVSREQQSKAALDRYEKQLKANADAVKAAQASVDEMQKAIDGARTEAEKARTDAQTDRSSKQGQFDTLTTDTKKMIDDLNVQIQAKQVEITALQTKTGQLDTEINRLKTRLAAGRVDTTEPSVRRIDGYVSRISPGNICFISLGQGDQVSNGMTFEVYDKIEGVPPMGKDGMRDEDMPVGKGSIEIISVGATISECRMVRQTPGQTITQGDPIANLIYDPNVKYNFVVYGKFDLDRNGVATDADTDVMKRLVTQWGGKVTDKIDVETDFAVLGKEPVLPVFTKDELDLPENQQKLAAAQADLDAYTKVRADAKDLHIPVMNQNRFLYFVGYYDQARR